MAARSGGRHRRRKNWKARFGFLIFGIILGTVLGIFLCFRFNIVAALDTAQYDARGALNALFDPRVITERPAPEDDVVVIPVPTPEAELPEAEETAAVTAEPETVTPDPAVVTPEPVMITPEPVLITPEPVMITPEPAVVTPEPVMITPEPAVATPEPAAETEAPETPAKTKAEVVQPYSRTEPFAVKEWFTFDTEIDANGEPYYMNDGNGVPATLSVRVADFMDPDEYAAQYAETYQLYGSEAALILEIRNDSAIAVSPQEAIRIAFANKADVLYDGYPLMDAPMAGSTDISIAPGETATVYKRFAYDEFEGLYPFVTFTYMVGGETYRSYTILNTLD